MKKFILSFVAVTISAISFSQTATLRLQTTNQEPVPGETLRVELWLDELNYDQPAIKSAQLFMEFDGKVLTPVSHEGIYHTNLNPLLEKMEIVPLSNSPYPGDLRFVMVTSTRPGIEFGPDVTFPVKLWDIQFTYLGGKTSIHWSTTNVLEPVQGEEHGGTLKKGATMMYALDNTEYKLNLIDAHIGTGN